MMNVSISVKDYEFVKTMARKFAYGNTKSNLYEEYLNVGIEGAIKAYKTYKDGSNVQFFTYLYRCVMNAMINEQKRIELHKLEEDDNVSITIDTYEGALVEMIEDNFEVALRNAIRKHTTNERNAKIVEMVIGLEYDPMELKEIAAMLNLSHESVRLVWVKAQKGMCEDKVAKKLLYSFVA